MLSTSSVYMVPLAFLPLFSLSISICLSINIFVYNSISLLSSSISLYVSHPLTLSSPRLTSRFRPSRPSTFPLLTRQVL